MQQSSEAPITGWGFLTNHAHVLVCVAHDPGIRLRDIAATVGITERAAHRILSELVEEGYVARERVGRRNRYQVKPELFPASSPRRGARGGRFTRGPGRGLDTARVTPALLLGSPSGLCSREVGGRNAAVFAPLIVALRADG